MAVSKKGKTAKVAVAGDSPIKQINPSDKLLIRTSDMLGVSGKLQKNGQKVIAMCGGSIGDKKVHYFRMSMEQAKNLKNEEGKPLLTEVELTLVEEVNAITPSKFIDTGLKETLLGNNKVPKINE